ncbi:hydrocephalus-inducing protein homolog [Haemorhous mexicanus]|uniref:hydrocephalus-inducing protein homolog n=1 Tax=Haemorhous mexicanus TaxID=30427 RepID=UPI0028BD4EF3|nr:hydrocephalus-inducing protein homolog [Haemorhous mexicanus]
MQEVHDYVMCEAVSGITRRTEKIIETVLTCKFIHPSIEVSARQFSFLVNKKPRDVLTLQYQPLALKNTCLLPLDLMLDLEQPFLVCDEDQQPLPDGQPVRVGVGETCHLYVAFDPAYELDFKSWKKEKILNIDMVRGHPFVERIVLRGEVHFPNLQIQPSTLKFGCIVAGTKEVRSLEMTNCSSLPVEYHWTFHSKSQVYRLRSLVIVMLYSRYELSAPKFQPKPPKEKRTSLESSVSRRRRFRIRKEEPVTALKESQDPAQSSGAEVPPESRGRYYIPLGLVGVKSPMDVLHTPLEVEEVFSIAPLSGVLRPGESQQVSFTFSSGFNTISDVMALCHVEGGPTYEVVVTGETSCVSYSLSPREIDCGSQMFNEIHHSKVTLENTCRSEFSWVLNPSTADQQLPGVFLVNPTTGSIAPGEKQVLEFSYMPGLPGAFSRTYQLKVGDLDPENICLKGEASFPMICMNLPWNIKENEKDEKPLTQLVKLAQEHSQRKKSVDRKKTQSLKTGTLKSQTQKTRTATSLSPKTGNLNPDVLDSGIAPNTQQINTVKTLIEKAALEMQEKLTPHPPESKFPDKELCQSLVKVELPEYVLDMGTVRKGFTERSTLEITNPGQIPVSFQIDVSVLQDTGKQCWRHFCFSMELDQVQGLPHSHTRTFDVRFESIRQPRGDVDVLLPIEVKKGPTYNIRLRAAVSELSLELSKNTLHFSALLVGQCQVETIQLYNWFRVPCRWSIKPVQKNNQHMYMTPAVHQKQQALEDEPCPFEVKPSKGTLGAGRWQKLQITFTPKEERSYKNELELNINGSSNCLKLQLSGQGLEPRLEFSPPALKMGWMLVDSTGVEATVVVKNPCNFPIEFYSLDFDEQHLEKKKVTDPKTLTGEILRDGKLPAEDQMLEHLGLHPDSPPLSPAAVLSSVEYPEKRLGSAERVQDNLLGAPVVPALKAKAPDAKGSSAKGQPKTGKATSRDRSAKEKQISTRRTESSRGSSATRSKSTLERASTPTVFLRLKQYRWIVPAQGEVELKVNFFAKKPGRFEQTLSFELVPSKRQYKLPCSGTGLYPSISQNPRVVFPQWRATMKEGEVIFKEYVESTKQFHFGPLLCGRSREWLLSPNPYNWTVSDPFYPYIRGYFSPFWLEELSLEPFTDPSIDPRCGISEASPLSLTVTVFSAFSPFVDRYKTQNCPGNSENITIFNNSPTDVKVRFSFENAGEADTFLLNPPRMRLKPKEKKELTIWAYPTSPGFLEDKLVCSIEKNPNPVVFSLCCYGVGMKMEVSTRELSFDKLLLHRTDCRTFVLKNNSMLPMAWQLRGLDDLVENFSLSQNNGILDPRSEFEVTLHFKAEQIGSIEKTLRLEVSDAENILGVVQTENIKISAEVYDVSLGIDMPEGADGSLEFGTINVLDKVKKVLSLKIKGIYRIEYRFTLKGAGPRMQDLASYFTVTPQSGMVNASHPDASVEIIFHPTSEILLKNIPILYCQVIDASSGEGGQAVTNIPIRVSAKAEYSKYSIVPASPTDFGAMIKGTKKSRTVVLKNNGTLSFKFHIRREPKLASALESKRSEKPCTTLPVIHATAGMWQAARRLGLSSICVPGLGRGSKKTPQYPHV